jgi:predicted small secreted protein
MTLAKQASLTRTLALIAVLGLGSIGLAACDEPGPAEEAAGDAGAAVDDAVESTGEAIEDAGEAVQEAVD